MKKPIVWILVGVVAVFALGGYLATSMARRALQAAEKKDEVKIERGEVAVKVVESGTIDAVKSVEVRSRASGRLKELFVDEGDIVQVGALIARIDPQETELRVQQDRAQLRGAASAVARADLEIEQQRITLRANLAEAEKRLATIRQELGIQPTLTRTAVAEAESRLASAKQARITLADVTHPNQRTELQRAVDDARNSFANAEREYRRQLDLVAKGYVAARTEETAKLQLDLERTRLQSAEANLSRLEQQQKLGMAQADADVRAAQAAYDRAMANTIQDDVKRREYEQAALAVERAKAALLQIPILRKSKEQSASQVAQLQSVLGDSMRQLGETDVRAPFSGTISKRYIETGDLVTGLSAFTSGTAIMRIEDRSRMRVKLEMNEIDVARVSLGMRATVTVDALPGRKLMGTVRKIAPASTGIAQAAQGGGAQSDAVVKFTVEVYLDEVAPEIRTGMSAKCTLEVVKKPNALRVPIAYLGKDDKGHFLMIFPAGAKPDAKPVRKDVKVGVNTGAFVEILSGAKEGESLARPEYKGPPRTGFMSAGPDEE